MQKIKVMSIFGTRPEAVKMAPIVKLMEQDELIDSQVLVTAQHREMLDQILSYFDIVPDYDLNLMAPNQSLASVTSKIIEGVTSILIKEKPNIILVHGDTTTTIASSIAAFYQKIKIGHVEAGLRTRNKYSPFPEEMNRQLTDVLSDIYFVPTEMSKNNLIKENKEKAAEEVDKIKNNIKMQQVIISKRQDVPGKYVLSKNEQDLYNLYSNGYKNIRKAMDNFLGENGCQKVFGDTNSLEMFDDLMEMLNPEFSKMGLSIENLKNRIKSKYSDKKENVI